MALLIGVGVGQQNEPSGLCVAEAQDRSGDHGPETHYTVPFVTRLPAGTSYPDLVDRTREAVSHLAEKIAVTPYVYVDATGHGASVVELFESRVRPSRVVGAYFTHGDRREEIGEREIQIGKAYLVGRLKTLLQTGCLHLSRTPEINLLVDELRDYEIKLVENANQKPGAFRVGPYDELVTALGLATQPLPLDMTRLFGRAGQSARRRGPSRGGRRGHR